MQGDGPVEERINRELTVLLTPILPTYLFLNVQALLSSHCLSC